ncbi:hypothetical protein ACM26V_09555 [Salipaludibacillus sp. HK11]|uniref:hypothetical protein n=1 Tax=Salipaludibacillus sp. HK11 TaxID=3394320 RepID=UPI0039FD609A
MDEFDKKMEESLQQSVSDIHFTNREKNKILLSIETAKNSNSYLKYYASLITVALLIIIIFVPTILEQFDFKFSDHPLELIDDRFDYHSFDLPSDWDTVWILEKLKIKESDVLNPENNVYEDIPLSYIIEFANKTEVNKHEQEEYKEMLEEQNESTAHMGESVLYSHSFTGESNASYGMSREEFTRPVITDESEKLLTEEFIINHVDVDYYFDGVNHVFQWERDDLFYDLYIVDNDHEFDLDDLLEIVEGFIII